MPRLQRRQDTSEEGLDLDALGREVEGWWGIKYQSKLIAKTLETGKGALLKLVQRHGEVDPETGSLFLELEEPVSDRHIARLKAQRAEVTGINPDAEKILRKLGIWDDCVEMVPQLDEGKVYAAYYDNKITNEDLARLFPKSIRFSLILLDENDRPVN
jgi:hypothetical protein